MESIYSFRSDERHFLHHLDFLSILNFIRDKMTQNSGKNSYLLE